MILGASLVGRVPAGSLAVNTYTGAYNARPTVTRLHDELFTRDRSRSYETMGLRLIVSFKVLRKAGEDPHHDLGENLG